MAYHVNPQTGVPGVCNAQAGRCPFGGVEDHHDSPAAAVKAFEASFVSSVPTPAVKAKADTLSGLNEARKAAEAAKAEADKYAGGTAERKAAWEKYRAALATQEAELRALEMKGLGHLIPDNGDTIRVATMEQKILLVDELQGQISDGMWENTTPHNHWEKWSSAEVIVDPKNVGRNFRAVKDNYQLNSSELLSIVGDRMVEAVRDQTNNPNYDEKKMRNDLAGLRKIFKNPRPVHTGSDDLTPSPVAAPAKPKAAPAPAPAPASTGLPTTPVAAKTKPGVKSSYAMNMGDHGNPAMIGAAMAGPGRQLPMGRYFSRHCGMANPITGDGDDYDHIKDGGVVIVGKADGSRARVIAGSGEALADPGAELGRPIEQTKQSDSGRDNVRSDLYVLGYRDRDGNKYGYVPDKKIQYFVFK